ncbi:hypothetical protein NQ318_014041 [Aromia moschata]|uniref:Tetratricopeptide SHNi-TPR domain-containing protein n=1 Tax=Aromia moschata TaxID=1265417 RepID=A0AAV8Z0V8_9CUCU|nr:hypothetical protein NQ318_014041 [Aromia moschata]
MRSNKIGRVFHKPYRVIIPNEREEDKRHMSIQQNGTIWYTDRSKTEQNTGAGATNRDLGCEISINLMADVVITENEELKDLLGQGVRAYYMQNYNAAVTALSKGSEQLVAEHGDDLHDSLADVYLYYGKSLLGLSREELGPLGDAVPKTTGESSSSSSDEEEVENTETEVEDNKANGVEINGQAQTNGASNGAGPSSSSMNGGVNSVNGMDTKPSEDEDPSDLQLAWEVLELAKKIFQRQGADSREKLADVLISLGEISLESENFVGAIEDIKEGLEIQKQLFGQDNRTVAETFYKLGVAYSTTSQFDEAIESFNTALVYLRNRVAALETGEKPEDMYEEEVQDEIKEIKALIPDVEEKIADMKSYKDETVRNIMSAVRESNPLIEGAESPDSDASRPATNISHLVKKKRKLDDIVEDDDKDNDGGPAKKTSRLLSTIVSSQMDVRLMCTLHRTVYLKARQN